MSPSAGTDASYTALRLSALAYAQTSPNLGIALDGSVSFSVDAWVKLNGLPASASILSKEGVFSLGIVGDTVMFQIAGYAPVQSDPRRQRLDDADWHYVCVTFAAGQVRVFIDGAFNVFQAISGRGGSSTQPFLIGQSLPALVSSVRVYPTALDSATVQAYMFGDPAPAATVAWFDFTQAPPIDRGSGHLPISLQSGAQMITITPSVSFKGTGYAQPLRDEQVNPGGRQLDPYTVQAWVFVDSTVEPEQVIFVNSDVESETGMALYLEWDQAALGFRVESQRGSNITGDTLESNAVIKARRWVNVATTFDGTTLAIYINGSLDRAEPMGPIPLIRNQGEVLLGAGLSEGEPFGTWTMQGCMSRLEVWRRALSATEIAAGMAHPPDIVAAQGLTASYDFTAAPARNVVDGHPVGLADGAELVSQAIPAGSGVPGGRLVSDRPADLDEETLRALVASIDFRDALRAQRIEFDEAMEADAAAVGDDDAAAERVRAAWRETIERLESDPTSLPFLVTQHRLDDEDILLCHTNGHTYVGFRAPAGTLDDCTMWEVRLVFVVVGGILSLFGLPSTLGQRAIDYIGRALRRPQIYVLLGAGGTIGANGIFGVAKALYDYGYLRELLWMVADIGIWAVVRIAAKFALWFVGAGPADVLVSFAATAVTFGLEYARRPTSCDPVPTVDLAGIKFNYDPTGAATDALSIRRNYTTKVATAEWTKGMTAAADSPAAYAIAAVSGKVVTMQARFVISGAGSGTAQIRATGGGVLGAIDPFPVTFKNGVSDPQWVTISLTHQQLAAAGVQRQDIQWTWSYMPAGGSWTPIGVTSHRIYVLLDVPTGPWRQSPNVSDTQLPWTDVLDYSCQWAAGATTTDAAAALVTAKVNGAIGLVYDNVNGATVYSLGGLFQCTQFLTFLKNGGGLGKTVNCTDSATIVTTFANSVGCNLFTATMYTASGTALLNFTLNQIVAIGATQFAWPFPNTPYYKTFAYHEVAWTGAGSYIDQLYDACLRVDSSTNPWDWTTPGLTHTPVLPKPLPFTTAALGISWTAPLPTPFTTQTYRERLATNDATGSGRCVPRGADASAGRRPVR